MKRLLLLALAGCATPPMEPITVDLLERRFVALSRYTAEFRVTPPDEEPAGLTLGADLPAHRFAATLTMKGAEAVVAMRGWRSEVRQGGRVTRVDLR